MKYQTICDRNLYFHRNLMWQIKRKLLWKRWLKVAQFATTFSRIFLQWHTYKSSHTGHYDNLPRQGMTWQDKTRQDTVQNSLIIWNLYSFHSSSLFFFILSFMLHEYLLPSILPQSLPPSIQPSLPPFLPLSFHSFLPSLLRFFFLQTSLSLFTSCL